MRWRHARACCGIVAPVPRVGQRLALRIARPAAIERQRRIVIARVGSAWVRYRRRSHGRLRRCRVRQPRGVRHRQRHGIRARRHIGVLRVRRRACAAIAEVPGVGQNFALRVAGTASREVNRRTWRPRVRTRQDCSWRVEGLRRGRFAASAAPDKNRRAKTKDEGRSMEKLHVTQYTRVS